MRLLKLDADFNNGKRTKRNVSVPKYNLDLKQTHEKALAKMGKQTDLLQIIKGRAHNRGIKYEILRLITETNRRLKICRKTCSQDSWLKDMRRWFVHMSTEIFRATISRAIYSRLDHKSSSGICVIRRRRRRS